MSNQTTITKEILQDLGDGLILRRSTPEDVEALAKFNGDIHADPDEESADHIAIWVRDLMSKPHPTFNKEDFTIVEDTKTGQIVSCLNLINQTWAYEGIEFGVGRVELVGTHADYRRRGLVRKQMETVHQWSLERGHKLQSITGIPWYYRQFEYEMTINLGGTRGGYPVHIPKLKKDETEPYQLRPATEADTDFILRLYQSSSKRNLVTCAFDQKFIRYEISGRNPKSLTAHTIRIIETPDGKVIGYLFHNTSASNVYGYELDEGHSWLAVTPSVLRYLQQAGEKHARQENEKDGKSEADGKRFESFGFMLGTEHPVYDAIPDRLPRTNAPYAWYIRVADIPDFLTHITPVLEQRLAESVAVGHTGELHLSFYTYGVKLIFDQGKITIERWEKPATDDAMATFPDLTFLKLLFGHRSFDELRHAYTDCYYHRNHIDAPVLLNILFPKKASHIWAIE